MLEFLVIRIMDPPLSQTENWPIFFFSVYNFLLFWILFVAIFTY